MSNDDILQIVSDVEDTAVPVTQPLANIPPRNRRHWVPAEWAPAGGGSGHPKIGGGFEVDTKTGEEAPRGFNRPDQRYALSEAELTARRDARAASEYPSSVILLNSDGAYQVRSESGNNYLVAAGNAACNCPDYLRLQQSGKLTVQCKHQKLVALALADPMTGGVINWSCEHTAAYSGIAIDTVRRACREGVLPAVLQHRVWSISPMDATQLALLYEFVKPTVTGITPASISSGSGDTMVEFIGDGFNDHSRVVCNNTTILTTTLIAGYDIQAIVPAALLAAPGTLFLKVENAFPGGSTSASVQLEVT